MPKHLAPKKTSASGTPASIPSGKSLRGANAPGAQGARNDEGARRLREARRMTPTPYGPSPTLDPVRERRRRRIRRVVGFSLVGVAIVLVATAVGLLADAWAKYQDQDAVNAQLAAYAEVSDAQGEAPQVDWEALKAVNPDVCAWLQIPGTSINFPVYQGDDNEHYLNTTAYGEYGVGGQVFLDCENANPGLVDEQTLVYGHHLQNGGMFAPLASFDDQATFDEHPTVWYVTEGQTFELAPILCYRTTGADEDVRIFNWPTREEFHAYLKNLLANSKTNMEDAAKVIPGINHVLTLSTCSYEEDNGRTLLVCAPKSEVAAGIAQAIDGNVSTLPEVPFNQAIPEEVG